MNIDRNPPKRMATQGNGEINLSRSAHLPDFDLTLAVINWFIKHGQVQLPSLGSGNFHHVISPG